MFSCLWISTQISTSSGSIGCPSNMPATTSMAVRLSQNLTKAHKKAFVFEQEGARRPWERQEGGREGGREGGEGGREGGEVYLQSKLLPRTVLVARAQYLCHLAVCVIRVGPSLFHSHF